MSDNQTENNRIDGRPEIQCAVQMDGGWCRRQIGHEGGHRPTRQAARTAPASQVSAFCDVARAAAVEASEAPVHERGFVLAALSNHIHECAICKGGRDV